MRRAVEILVPGSPPAPAYVDAPCTAGGSHADGVLLSGVAAGALLLSPCAAGLVVEARVAGVRAAGSALPPAARRLLRPGERAEVLGVGLVVPEEGGSSDTRELAASLLRAAVHGEAAVAGAHLLVLTGPRAGVRLPLGSEQVIGRGRSAAVRLPDPLASRRHARLTILPDRAHLEDLGAKNGVRVNGVRVAGRTAVVAGDEIALGETLLALVLPGESPPAERQEPPRAIAPSASRRRWPGAAPLGAAALLALSAAALAVSTW